MRQAVLRSPGEFELVDVPVPSIASDELLVRVIACGVCASELDMFTGQSDRPFPIVPGHEVSGVVDNLATVDLDEVKATVKAWKPAAGGGGCCGG